jgi:hypothetical protein
MYVIPGTGYVLLYDKISGLLCTYIDIFAIKVRNVRRFVLFHPDKIRTKFDE